MRQGNFSNGTALMIRLIYKKIGEAQNAKISAAIPLEHERNLK
jgi:hypothetical protein